MDGVAAGGLGDFEDLVDLEVALGHGGGADEVGLLGARDVRGVDVGFRVDGDGVDAQLLASTIRSNHSR